MTRALSMVPFSRGGNGNDESVSEHDPVFWQLAGT